MDPDGQLRQSRFVGWEKIKRRGKLGGKVKLFDKILRAQDNPQRANRDLAISFVRMNGGLMRSIAMLICVFVTAAVTGAADTPGVLRQVLVMTESEDDKPLNDSFELWDTFCRL